MIKTLKIILLSLSIVAFTGMFTSINAGECNNGGPGSSSCNDGGTIGFLGFTFSWENSVSCDEGEYACCNGEKAFCIPDGEQPPKKELEQD